MFGGPTAGPGSPATWTADLAAKYPNGVRFSREGFPNFRPYAIAHVKVTGLTGVYSIDAKLANEELARKLGLPAVPKTPDGFVWHHVEDGESLLLLPQDLHNAVKHTGGAAVITGGG